MRRCERPVACAEPQRQDAPWLETPLMERLIAGTAVRLINSIRNRRPRVALWSACWHCGWRRRCRAKADCLDRRCSRAALNFQRSLGTKPLRARSVDGPLLCYCSGFGLFCAFVAICPRVLTATSHASLRAFAGDTFGKS
jgi:hypothetical protein